MSDVAARVGLTKNTVSLALRHDPQIPKKTRARILRAARTLGYKKNPTVAHLMAQLRTSRSSAFQAPLALLNANLDPAALTRHPTVPVYVQGCRKRSAELGYGLDEFWLHDPQLDAKRLERILRTRNVRGVIVVGLMKENRLPSQFLPIWKQFPTVVTGVRTHDPALSFACSDQHILALKAFEQALALGYQRPALVLDREIDLLVDGRFTSGVHIAQQRLPKSRQTKPFYQINEARHDPRIFRKWFEQEKPDVVLTLYNVVRHWLEGMGLAIPRDIGFIQLEWRKDHADDAGMNQHNEIVGEAAVEMVINMIHHHTPGVQPFPRATFIGSTWVDGKSVKRKAS
jgi:LacI family transcriptional regulator